MRSKDGEGSLSRSAALSQKAVLPMITPSVLPLRVKSPSPRGRLIAVTVKFLAELKGSPLGELARNA